ncbi:fibrobacter succinogenes major paralogous domain-containing protein [Candidatus Desantisbacteria bacterium]|nr:fibrobacter succinogenes major paralogous domain-containing protein [Candidatus Desantisbacteria bacterium]
MEKLIDIDGNAYSTVQIGNQIWTTKNLSTTKFNDGTVIPNVIDDEQWSKLITPGYCFYDNTADISAREKYGALYNWYAVDTKKLAPTGWHVPTDAEWQTLSDFLGGDGVARIEMFEEFLCGYRGYGANFDYQDCIGGWWSTAESDALHAYSRNLYYRDSILNRDDDDKVYGFSVRLIKD